MKGTYCLIIDVKKDTKILVGSLKEIEFKRGFYIYIGSAMNSLIPRLKRHLSDEKRLHWHVDYLLTNQNVGICEILFNISEEKIECELARNISKEGEEITKFGCSDCDCNSHLIYFESFENSLDAIKSSYNKLNIDYDNLKYFNTLLINN